MRGEAEKLVFIDLETAGVDVWRPIIQVAAIALDSGLHELESFEAKIRFRRRFADPKALRKPHYSAARWRKEAQPVREVADKLAEFLARHASVELISLSGRPYRVAQLVAHNAAFDGPFLQTWFERLGRFFPGHFRTFCTLQRALWLFQEDKSLPPPADFQLTTLCRYFGVRLDPGEAHDALADVRATVELYRAMQRRWQALRAAA
jgi:DNA polymerase III epsilon subunit-like protein